MLGLTIQKMRQKIWMNLCLILGCTLLIATVISFPLYEKAAFDRMLSDEFRSYIAAEGIYPAIIQMRTVSQRDKNGKTISRIEKKMDGICDELSLTQKQQIKFYYLQKSRLSSDMNRKDAEDLSASLGYMTDIEKHIELISGEMFSDTGVSEDGTIEVIASQNCMVSLGLIVGESFTYSELRLPDGSPVKVVVKGVFNMDYEDPYYWQVKPEDISDLLFIKPELFETYFTGKNAGRYTIHSNIYSLFNYEDITNDQVETLLNKTVYLKKKSKYKSVTEDPLYTSILENYLIKVNRISITLVILQIPVLIMLAAFLLMISGQMYEMEKNEISVIKSRGSSRWQIFRIYLSQGVILSLLGAALAFPLGSYFAKALGASKAFLEFDSTRNLNISYTKEVFIYAIAAVVITLISITIPAIFHSRVSIVNLKQSKSSLKKSLWKKLYLDIVLIGVSLYGYFNFRKNIGNVSLTVLSGESLDPLLYISSSLFIIGLALLYLRIQPLFIRFILSITKNRLKPAAFISFTEAVKQSSKQQLIMLFLIMTVSLGMYHSTVARTILDNAVNNQDYIDGVDLILGEKWKAIVDERGVYTGNYVEPDIKKYETMDFAEKYTKVYFDDEGYISEGKNSNQSVTIMGIHTRKFGEITSLDSSIISKPYYETLNNLSNDPKTVILSANFRDKLGYDIGDTIYFHNSVKQSLSYKVVDFFEYFPGYNPVKIEINPDGKSEEKDNYLIVGHFDQIMQETGVKPYELWMQLTDKATEEEIYNWINDNDVRVAKYVNRKEDIKKTINDPILQGTNGVLTLGFVVTIILCATGYLIYWIMSIKERELIFGVLRASGFHKGEIIKVLLNEQIFSGFLSVIAGIIIGYVSSRLFVPIIQLSYASSSQVLPLRLTMSLADQLRLFGLIAGVMIICLIVLIALLSRMNITKALKLGEE